jgi:hypothetical protein
MIRVGDMSRLELEDRYDTDAPALDAILDRVEVGHVQ